MNAKSLKNTGTSVLEAIKGGIEMVSEEIEKANAKLAASKEPTNEPNPEPAAEEAKPTTSSWGAFTIEVGIEPPPGVLRDTTGNKYNWAQFPAPSDPDNPKTWPSVFIPHVGSNTISGSIKAYREKLQKANKDAPVPDFGITVIKGQEASEAVEAVEATEDSPAVAAVPAKPFIQGGVRVFRKS